MDPIRKDDIERARRMSPEERARQALELMRQGIRLRKLALRERHPADSEQQIEDRLRRWLAGDG